LARQYSQLLLELAHASQLHPETIYTTVRSIPTFERIYSGLNKKQIND